MPHQSTFAPFYGGGMAGGGGGGGDQWKAVWDMLPQVYITEERISAGGGKDVI